MDCDTEMLPATPPDPLREQVKQWLASNRQGREFSMGYDFLLENLRAQEQSPKPDYPKALRISSLIKSWKDPEYRSELCLPPEAATRAIGPEKVLCEDNVLVKLIMSGDPITFILESHTEG